MSGDLDTEGPKLTEREDANDLEPGKEEEQEERSIGSVDLSALLEKPSKDNDLATGDPQGSIKSIELSSLLEKSSKDNDLATGDPQGSIKSVEISSLLEKPSKDNDLATGDPQQGSIKSMELSALLENPSDVSTIKDIPSTKSDLESFFDDLAKGTAEKEEFSDQDFLKNVEHKEEIPSKAEEESVEDSKSKSRSVRISEGGSEVAQTSNKADDSVQFSLIDKAEDFSLLGSDEDLEMPSVEPSLESLPELSSDRLADIKIDRNMYYQMHDLFKFKYQQEKMKNNFLHAKLASYYMRRQMFYVLREQTLQLAEVQTKYEKELDVLERLTEESARERQLCEGEARHMTVKRDTQATELAEKWEKLLKDELEYGKSLTFEKTGKQNMDKVVERFLRRQRSQMALLIKLRLQFIRLRNRLSEKTQELEALDHLGKGFGIMDYVQLRVDNRDLHDKLEGKDAELTRLRRGCQNTMQVMAHIREKNAVLDLDVNKLDDDFLIVAAEFEDAREQLHYLRRERDDLRKQMKKLKNEYGLLTNRKALRDMEAAINEVAEMEGRIDREKKEHDRVTEQLHAIRRNRENMILKKAKEEREKAEGRLPVISSSATLFKGFQF